MCVLKKIENLNKYNAIIITCYSKSKLKILTIKYT